jgi:hypothetical protein
MMLIPSWVWWALMIATALAGVFGIGMVKVGALKSGTRREKIATFALLGCLAACGALYFFHRKVVVCTETGGQVHAERQVELGGSGDGTLVVNHTSHELRIITFWYGGFSVPSDPTPVPPGASVVSGEDVDNIGPTNEPPSSVMSSMKIDSRTWLTW